MLYKIKMHTKSKFLVSTINNSFKLISNSYYKLGLAYLLDLVSYGLYLQFKTISNFMH